METEILSVIILGLVGYVIHLKMENESLRVRLDVKDKKLGRYIS